MTEQEAKNIAEPIVKEIVNCISSGQYEHICRFATMKYVNPMAVYIGI